jgi:hypothetical protein
MLEQERKYILTPITKVIGGNTLYRIRAVRSFSDVERGDLGGYIANDKNLSHSGDAWVYDNGCVYESARILHDARVFNQGTVHALARLEDKAWVSDKAVIKGTSVLAGKTWVFNGAVVSGGAYIYSRDRADCTVAPEPTPKALDDEQDVYLRSIGKPLSDCVVSHSALRDAYEEVIKHAAKVAAFEKLRSIEVELEGIKAELGL